MYLQHNSNCMDETVYIDSDPHQGQASYLHRCLAISKPCIACALQKRAILGPLGGLDESAHVPRFRACKE
jgi:hypothetical protein